MLGKLSAKEAEMVSTGMREREIKGRERERQREKERKREREEESGGRERRKREGRETERQESVFIHTGLPGPSQTELSTYQAE